MSVAYILDPTYSYVKNENLNQNLELTGSLKAPVHYVEDLTISKNLSGSLVLDAPVVEATVIQTDSVNAVSGVFSSALNPLVGSNDISVSGNLDLSNNGLKNVSSLSVNGSPAVAGYVLSTTDTNGTLAWVPDATGSTPTIQQVLQTGSDAGGEQLSNLGPLTGTTIDLGKAGQFGRIQIADATPSTNIQISGEYGGYMTVNEINSNTGSNFKLSSSGVGTIIDLASDVVINQNKFLQASNIKDALGALGTAGQVLAKDPSNTYVVWKDDAVGTVPTIAQVLEAGDNADGKYLQNLSYLSVEQVSGGIVVEVDTDFNVLSSSTDAIIQGFDTISAKTKLSAPTTETQTVQAGALSDMGLFVDAGHKIVMSTEEVRVGDVGKMGVLKVQDDTATTQITLNANNGSVSAPLLRGNTLSGNGTFRVIMGSELHMNGKRFKVNPEGAPLTDFWEDSLGTGGKLNAYSIDQYGGYFAMRNDSGNKLISQSSDNAIASQTGASLTGFGSVSCVDITNSNRIRTKELASDSKSSIEVFSGIDMNDNSIANVNNANFNYLLSTNIQVGTLEPTVDLKLRTDSGIVEVNQLSSAYKPERTLWVSPNNTFATPNGSYENPYTTIQQAINYAESVYDNTYWYINVLPGTYAGFTVTKKVFIKGMAPSNPDGCSVGCQITSDITVAISSNDGDMFNNTFGISSILIAGCKIVDSSTARHVLNITDCYLYNDSGTGRSIDCRPSSSDCRLQIFNSKVINTSSSAGDPLVELSVGMARFYQTQFQCGGVQNVVKFSGTSKVDSIVLCSFTATNGSIVQPPLVEITSNTLSAFTFANSSFVYTSTNDKSANPSSCAIYGNASATPTIITVLYNTFSLAGTVHPSNFVINYNTVPSITYFFSNSAIPNTTHKINGTANTLTAVN